MNVSTEKINLDEVEVEVVLKKESNISRKRLVGRLDNFLKDGQVTDGVATDDFGGTDLEDDVESVKICLENNGSLENKDLQYFIFKLNQEDAEENDLSESGGEEIVAASSSLL